jgi:threonyl-tRNA synthetase
VTASTGICLADPGRCQAVDQHDQGRGPALELIRHDLAHIMARAVQDIWPDVKVTIGPVRDYGWFYDFDRAEPFTPEDLGQIEARMKQIINAREPVRKPKSGPREKAVEYYRGRQEPFKLELIDRIPEGEDLRMYWHGPWQDLCRGHTCNTRGRCLPMPSS